MAFANFTDLRGEVLAKLLRPSDSDAIARFPSWLALFESRAKRMLRAGVSETRTSFTANSEFTALPADFVKARSLRLVTGSSQVVPLYPMAPSTGDEYLGGATGEPRYYLIEGTDLRLVPTPSGTVTVELVYYALPALTVAAPTNWLLSTAPDVYYHGALAEAAKYYEDRDNAAMHMAERDAGIADLNKAHSFRNLGAGMAMRPNTQTP